jgi:hypothetical protein
MTREIYNTRSVDCFFLFFFSNYSWGFIKWEALAPGGSAPGKCRRDNASNDDVMQKNLSQRNLPCVSLKMDTAAAAKMILQQIL